REPNLWFHDGNVIVRAGDRFCRLYRELLATQSSVLADKPADAETFNGLPVLTLPDEPDEVLVWLKSLLLYPRLIGPQKVLAVLRLSHKYNISYLVPTTACTPSSEHLLPDQAWGSSGALRRLDFQHKILHGP
ncbi:hypothetical protein K523DRAFT_278076, partial [Schizophyllum commune Tattone D]